MSSQKQPVINMPYTLEIDTGLTLTGASSIYGYYRKPDGTTGTISGSITETTKISIPVTATVNDQSGNWVWHGQCVLVGDDPVFTKAVPLYVKDEFET